MLTSIITVHCSTHHINLSGDLRQNICANKRNHIAKYKLKTEIKKNFDTKDPVAFVFKRRIMM